MIDHVWTVVCSNFVTDRDSNNVSIQNVIEQFNIQGMPQPKGVIPVEFNIATLWVRSDFNVPSTGRARVTLLAPSGKKLKILEYDLKGLADHEGLRARQRVRGFPAPEPGRYTLYLELKNDEEEAEEWHHVASIPLKVVFVPPKANSEEAKQD